MANFEAFCRNFSSSINLFFLKSVVALWHMSKTLPIYLFVQCLFTSIYYVILSQQYFKGAAYSGSWLCCSTIDRMKEGQLSTLVPWIQAIAETLKKIRKKKSSGKAHLPNGETIVVIAKSFLCFTASPLYIGRHELPINLKVSDQVPKNMACICHLISNRNTYDPSLWSTWIKNPSWKSCCKPVPFPPRTLSKPSSNRLTSVSHCCQP